MRTYEFKALNVLKKNLKNQHLWNPLRTSLGGAPLKTLKVGDSTRSILGFDMSIYHPNFCLLALWKMTSSLASDPLSSAPKLISSGVTTNMSQKNRHYSNLGPAAMIEHIWTVYILSHAPKPRRESSRPRPPPACLKRSWPPFAQSRHSKPPHSSTWDPHGKPWTFSSFSLVVVPCKKCHDSKESYIVVRPPQISNLSKLRQ